MLISLIREYEEILKIFNLERESFLQRKKKLDNILTTSINWSSSYLDFFPYSSLINQLKPAIIYKEEKKTSIKNYYLNDELIFATNNENENWGSLFIENDDESKKSLLFVENDDEDMVLQQLSIAYFQDNKYDKVVSYMNDEDNDEESLTVDLFEYDINNIKKITRYGFFEDKSNILPVREFDFSYTGNNVKILAKDEADKTLLIYDGKKMI